ncbi:hypothetical protein G6011_05746 [Alternaria panax]|uniref:Heterokaryon incompatibility domain-containing protein n=1 Tax=Alternaria panax TaxID=48097 RepID=A0AAD4I3X5_9PLEO|nr:hypothetical protein G6011_05746 [Alternaria panax]
MQPEGSEFVASEYPAPSTTPADIVERCSNCNSDLSADDLDLKSVAGYFNQEETHRRWEEGAADGCIFCHLIAAVWADAAQQSRCYRSGYVKVGLVTDERYSLRLVNILSKLPHTLDRGVYATIAIYLKDSNLPNILEEYKPVSQQAIDPACLSLAKQWLSTCQNRHQRCDTKFDTAGPARLVDLRGDIIKLVLAPEESTRGSYIALSHCWGPSQPLRTTSESLTSFQEQIPANDLPQTFSDAIYVARAL